MISHSERVFIWVLLLIVVELFGVFARSKPNFNVANLPKFLPTSSNFTYRVGQVAVLKCAVLNLGKKKIVWRRASDSVPLTVGLMSFDQDPRYAVEHERHSSYWNLLIRNVQISDSGVYECQVSSKMRHLRHHVTLTIVDPPTPPPQQPMRPKITMTGSTFVDEGQPIYLVCNASSKEYPAEDIDWFRTGIALESRPSEGIYIRKNVSINKGMITSTLEIKNARLKDQGTYVCRTSNRYVTSTIVNVLKANKDPNKRGTGMKGDDDDDLGERHYGYNNGQKGSRTGSRSNRNQNNASPRASVHAATLSLLVLTTLLTTTLVLGVLEVT